MVTWAPKSPGTIGNGACVAFAALLFILGVESLGSKLAGTSVNKCDKACDVVGSSRTTFSWLSSTIVDKGGIACERIVALISKLCPDSQIISGDTGRRINCEGVDRLTHQMDRRQTSDHNKNIFCKKSSHNDLNLIWFIDK